MYHGLIDFLPKQSKLCVNLQKSNFLKTFTHLYFLGELSNVFVPLTRLPNLEHQYTIDTLNYFLDIFVDCNKCLNENHQISIVFTDSSKSNCVTQPEKHYPTGHSKFSIERSIADSSNFSLILLSRRLVKKYPSIVSDFLLSEDRFSCLKRLFQYRNHSTDFMLQRTTGYLR